MKLGINQEKLISDLVDMLFEAKKAIEFLPILPGFLRKSHLQVLQMIQKIQDLKGEVKVTDISKGLKITSPNITKLLNELEEMSLICKKQSVTDKRVVLIELTGDGEETLNHYVKDYHAKLSIIIEKIGQEDCQCAVQTIQTLSREMKKLTLETEEGEE